MEGAEELGTSGKDSGTGGSQFKGLGDVFQGSSVGGTLIWVVDVGADTPHGTDPRKLAAQDFHADNGEAEKATGGRELGFPTSSDINIGGRFLEYGSLCYEEAEYDRTVYCDADYS